MNGISIIIIILVPIAFQLVTIRMRQKQHYKEVLQKLEKIDKQLHELTNNK